MSQKNYNNIKRYAAFLFMVFTVLSGSSEKYDAVSILRTGKIAFVDISAINKLFIQGMKASAGVSDIKDFTRSNESFRDFLDVNGETSVLKYFMLYMLPLALSVCSFNNSITQNNTWRSALF